MSVCERFNQTQSNRYRFKPPVVHPKYTVGGLYFKFEENVQVYVRDDVNFDSLTVLFIYISEMLSVKLAPEETRE